MSNLEFSPTPASPASEKKAAPSASEMTTFIEHIGSFLTVEPLGTQELVERIAKAAAESVAGAEVASVTELTEDGAVRVLALTHPVASAINELQATYREGPRFETVGTGQRWVAGDLATDQRWPSLGPRVAQLGIRSMLTTAICSHPHPVMLNLFSAQLRAFDADDPTVEWFADRACVALGHANSIRDLNTALDSRTVIGQAMGILMGKYGLDADGAFRYLVRISQDNNVKLRVIAERLVHEHQNVALPDR